MGVYGSTISQLCLLLYGQMLLVASRCCLSYLTQTHCTLCALLRTTVTPHRIQYAFDRHHDYWYIGSHAAADPEKNGPKFAEHGFKDGDYVLVSAPRIEIAVIANIIEFRCLKSLRAPLRLSASPCCIFNVRSE
jgi:hypothetical protein